MVLPEPLGPVRIDELALPHLETHLSQRDARPWILFCDFGETDHLLLKRLLNVGDEVLGVLDTNAQI